MGSERAGSADRDQLLHIYLADHRAGSAGGVALARRIAKQNSNTHLGREMNEIANGIAEDQARLDSIMGQLGASRKRWREAAAMAAERLGRLKTNGMVLHYSPSSRVLEIEGLIMGVSGKLQLWRSLMEALREDPRLDAGEIERLSMRAEDQRSRLEQLHADAAKLAF